MKKVFTCLLTLILCAPLTNAESLSKGVRRIGKTLSAPERVLKDPTLRVLSAGQLLTPVESLPEASLAKAALVIRTGKAPRGLSDADGGVFAGIVKPVAAYALPVEFRSLTRDSTAAQPRSIQFEPVVLVLNALRFQPKSGRFEADLVVGLRNRTSPQDRSELPDAVTLLLSSDADEVSPAEILITRLGDPKAVRISSVSPATPFKLAAATLLDDGDSVEIPVVRPTLVIESSRGSINGWGLEKTSVYVQADKIASAKGLRVSMKTTQGEVSPAEIVLDEQGRGSAQLRSSGLGATTITVGGRPFEAGKTIVEFGRPLSSLGAALLGALVGWVIHVRSRRKKTLWSAIVSIASAAFVCAAYSVGIRLAQWAPDANAGEALFFFVAAVGAYSGVKALVPVARQSASERS